MIIRKNKKGFTILELLVVVAIIAILAAITVAGVSDSRTKSRIAKIKSNINSIQKQAVVYFNTTGNYKYGSNDSSGYARPDGTTSGLSSGNLCGGDATIQTLLISTAATSEQNAWCIVGLNRDSFMVYTYMMTTNRIMCADHRGYIGELLSSPAETNKNNEVHCI